MNYMIRINSYTNSEFNKTQNIKIPYSKNSLKIYFPLEGFAQRFEIGNFKFAQNTNILLGFLIQDLIYN